MKVASNKTQQQVDEASVKEQPVKFIPNVGKLLIRPALEQKKTKAGILLPGDSQEKTFHGIVVAAGEGVGCKVGDRIYYGQYAGIPTALDEGFFLTMDNKDWLGIIPK